MIEHSRSFWNLLESWGHLGVSPGFDHSFNIEKTRPWPDMTPTRPQGQTFSQPNHAQSSSNFPDILLILYQHNPLCQRGPYPSSLQSGTFNIIQTPQRPPSPQHLLSQPDHVWSWSNFQDRPLSKYQHHLWCSTWPNPSIMQSGSINILQAL